MNHSKPQSGLRRQAEDISAGIDPLRLVHADDESPQGSEDSVLFNEARLQAQLRDAIRNLHRAQSQLDSLQRSSAYKLSCSARDAFEFFISPSGWLRFLNRNVRWVARILLDEGLSVLCARAGVRLQRLCGKLLRIRRDVPMPTAQHDAPLQSKVLHAPVTCLNLIYHVTPVQHPDDVWQWNVRELLKRLHHFNGRRIITVVTQTTGWAMDPPQAVVDAFAGHDVEFRFAPNDPKLREAPHFFPAMREIASTNPGEAVFYAHTKGVSHLDQRVVGAWTSAMYHHNLDRIEEVRNRLRRSACAGIAKRYGYFENLCFGAPRKQWTVPRRQWHDWHFAGTFWWVRHDRLFSNPDWDRIPLHPYVVEGYLANFFKADEAACLAYDNVGEPYDPLTWQPAAA
jgi:hypothetical protein